MITIGMDYLIIAGKEQLFVEKFNEVIVLLEKTEHHLKTRLYKDVYEDQPTFLLVSEWETRDAFLDFIKSDVFRQTTAWGLREIMRDRPRHRVYQTDKLESSN